MKKALAILMTVCLLASLFVACDNNARIDELVKASFDASESRALIVSNESFIDFEDPSIIWEYMASKVSDETYNVGAAPDWKPIPGTNPGKITNVVEFSQGKWNFELRAVKKDESGSVTCVVYYGQTKEPVLLTKQSDGQPKRIVINLTAQLSDQKGYIVLNNVSIKHANGTDVFDAPSKVVIDAGTANKKVLELDTNYSSTGTSISTLGEGYEISVGTHTVKVQKIGDNNEILAEEEKTIEVYAGLKTTISNWVLEITQTGQFAPVAPTGTTSGNVSSATDGNLKLTVKNVTPSMVSGNDTTVTVPTAVFGQETTATVSVAVKQASEASVDNSFTASNGNAVAAVIDLTLSVGTTPKTEFSSPIKVETYVAKNLSEFQFSYPGEEDEWSKKNSLEDVTAAKNYYYDGTTGKLTFFTDHFSSFVVETSSVAVIGDTAYSTFSDALSHASEGDTIVLINDITIDYESGNCCISIEDKNITIDGSGKTISLGAKTPDYDTCGLLVKGEDSSKIVTIKNAKINTTNLERAIRTVGKIGVVIEDCTITTNGCGIHVKGENEVEINSTQITVNVIDKYTAHLRTAVMVGGSYANVTVNGCTITAINSYKTDNTSTWCKGLYVGAFKKNAKITAIGTSVTADYSIAIDGAQPDGTEFENEPTQIVIESGTYTGIIGTPSGNSYKSLTINGGTFSGLTSLNSFYGKDNDVAKLVISGGTFNIEPASKYIADRYYAKQNGDSNYKIERATNWIQRADASWHDDPEKKDFVISSAEELAGLAKLVNNGNSFSGKTIKLNENIDLVGLKWTPIGISGKAFCGTFDGNNKTISNLCINSPSTSDVGLFGFTKEGEVKNLTVNNAEIKGYLDVGVVAGTPYTSEYSNIKVTGSVKVDGYAYVGGAFGKNLYANATDITVQCSDDSYVRADSEAYRTYVGGIVGFMGEGKHTVSNVTSNIDVYGSTCDVGGITGIAHYNNTFENCSSSGNVYITAYSDNGDQLEIGGIAGVWHNENGTTVTIKGCSFTGNISATNKNGTVFDGEFENNGLVGKQYSSTGTGVLNITQ